VVLNFLVGVDGNIKKAEIATSSGYPGLDKAALTSLVQCHFTPAMLDGAPVEKWAPVTYVWSIS
jgi:TonB family protein